MGLSIDPSDFLKGIAEADTKMRRLVEPYAKSAAAKLEAWAKDPPFEENPYNWAEPIGENPRKDGSHYKWRDRTPAACGSIQGSADWEGDNMVVSVSGNVDYSVCLEFAHEKAYAVLMPAVEANQTDILLGMTNLLNK